MPSKLAMRSERDIQRELMEHGENAGKALFTNCYPWDALNRLVEVSSDFVHSPHRVTELTMAAAELIAAWRPGAAPAGADPVLKEVARRTQEHLPPRVHADMKAIVDNHCETFGDEAAGRVYREMQACLDTWQGGEETTKLRRARVVLGGIYSFEMEPGVRGAVVLGRGTAALVPLKTFRPDAPEPSDLEDAEFVLIELSAEAVQSRVWEKVGQWPMERVQELAANSEYCGDPSQAGHASYAPFLLRGRLRGESVPTVSEIEAGALSRWEAFRKAADSLPNLLG